jgi:hypothetical protein
MVLDVKNCHKNLDFICLYHLKPCHARMYGLIHDDRLQACQSCLLGLMYVIKLLYIIRCFRIMACLGFQLVDGSIKGQALPFSY